LTKADKPTNNDPEVAETPPPIMEGENEKVLKLVAEMLSGETTDIRPQLDYASETGFVYPVAERILGVKAKQVVPILDSLVDKGILSRNFFERLLHCPQCRSLNLRPTTHCPKCGSGNIARGRVLEHLICGYVGLEDEFLAKGRYICPRQR
jgi:hypothetical protein